MIQCRVRELTGAMSRQTRRRVTYDGIKEGTRVGEEHTG